MSRTRYAVGFAYSEHRVALIRKNRPDWQAGLLNGIGGHATALESPSRAMVREFKEETGMEWYGWEPVLQMIYPDAEIFFYRLLVPDANLDLLKTTTDEEVVISPRTPVEPTIPNLSWILPLVYYPEKYTHHLIEGSWPNDV